MSLSHIYINGRGWPVTTTTHAGDFLYGIPKRQQELLSLARQQVELQRDALTRIESANIRAGEMVRREIGSQTRELENAIAQSASEMNFAIDMLGDRLSGELSEIRWVLQQQVATTEQMLEVLKRPRSTEAQELIRQGVRNLINEKYAEAEDRFGKALDLDNTDYQVLVNLGYIAIHNENPEKAIEFFKDSLTLPDYVDKELKADGLWAIGRIYYAIENYTEAYAYARKSLEVLESPRRIFRAGVYSVLCGKRREAIALLESAIRKDRTLFALASSDPDLKGASGDVLGLLKSLSEEAFSRIRMIMPNVEEAVRNIRTGRSLSSYEDLVRKAENGYMRIKDAVATPRYSNCITAISDAGIILDIAPYISKIYSECVMLGRESETKDEKENIYQHQKREYRERRLCGTSYELYFVVSYFVLGIIYVLLLPKGGSVGGPIGFIVWPLIFVITGALTLLAGTSADVAVFSKFFGYAILYFVGLVSIRSAYCTWVKRRSDEESQILSESRKELTESSGRVESHLERIGEWTQYVRGKLEELSEAREGEPEA